MNKETYNEILDQLNNLTAQVKDLIEDNNNAETFKDDEGFAEKIIDNDDSISLYATWLGELLDHIFIGLYFVVTTPACDCTVFSSRDTKSCDASIVILTSEQ